MAFFTDMASPLLTTQFRSLNFPKSIFSNIRSISPVWPPSALLTSADANRSTNLPEPNTTINDLLLEGTGFEAKTALSRTIAETTTMTSSEMAIVSIAVH